MERANTDSNTKEVQQILTTEWVRPLKPKSELKGIVNQNIEWEEVGGKMTYWKLLTKGKLCGPTVWKRVLREMKDVNDDFHSLRTHMAPVADMIGVLHFLVYPADGAMADKPLCGRILIPKYYPKVPPVVHLFTQTNRYNVDVYRWYIDSLDDMHSSM